MYILEAPDPRTPKGHIFVLLLEEGDHKKTYDIRKPKNTQPRVSCYTTNHVFVNALLLKQLRLPSGNPSMDVSLPSPGLPCTRFGAAGPWFAAASACVRTGLCLQCQGNYPGLPTYLYFLMRGELKGATFSCFFLFYKVYEIPVRTNTRGGQPCPRIKVTKHDRRGWHSDFFNTNTLL